MHGSQEIGTYLIYLFLFVIGVPANIYTVLTKSPLLLALAFIMVAVNMVFCFGAARLLRFDLEDALVGVLGYVIGNYAGTMVGILLGA